ncbi:xanthine dehydrogenase family protein subunit M [Inquilinus sp. Marseille-Q2685]|uniref:FAD binding domain-containing protein n=1 Tax=Inquilinus sp. Marseille-Q2685 TaxID=2866581 RepID=UPI001CE3F972|nr:xanthine dehydrogenase family protein subunit M [Inquilinus sp. Marseille-Q2685]
MQSFAYERAATLAQAIGAAAEPGTAVIAGGTELLNWMKDGIAAPRRLVDLNHLPGLDSVTADASGLRIGALARMSDLAEHPAIRRDWPAVSQALLQSASAQIRTMASIGGNLMQRTRCPYFRAEVELPCNRRRPGSGCAALAGEDRSGAIFGWTEQCVATHPSDVAVALAALDAVVHVDGPGGPRAIPIADFHPLPDHGLIRESVLEPGELITAIEVPASAAARRSHYLKLRERASYEFALVSAAVGLDLDGPVIREARIALGGVAAKPWRLREAEEALRGVMQADEPALRRALDAGFAEARPLRRNGFKVELAKRAVIRALQIVGGVA